MHRFVETILHSQPRDKDVFCDDTGITDFVDLAYLSVGLLKLGFHVRNERLKEVQLRTRLSDDERFYVLEAELSFEASSDDLPRIYRGHVLVDPFRMEKESHFAYGDWTSCQAVLEEDIVSRHGVADVLYVLMLCVFYMIQKHLLATAKRQRVTATYTFCARRDPEEASRETTLQGTVVLRRGDERLVKTLANTCL